MKKTKIWIGVLFVVTALLVIASSLILRDSAKAPTNSTIINAFDPINTVYTIENKPVTLVNGRSADTLISVFGMPTTGDLNNDGKNDAVFILTQNTDGSGTFFYLASAINSSTGTLGTNIILLGDRISPQNIEIKDGQIIANYADRKPGEPMTTQPSVGVSRYFKVTGNTLSEVHPFSQVTNRTWKWTNTKMSDGTSIIPKKTATFTLHFKTTKL